MPCTCQFIDLPNDPDAKCQYCWREAVKERDSLRLQVHEAVEKCAKVVDSFDTFYWSDTQRNVVRIIADAIRTGQPASNYERQDIDKRKPETQRTREREDGFHDNLC